MERARAARSMFGMKPEGVLWWRWGGGAWGVGSGLQIACVSEGAYVIVGCDGDCCFDFVHTLRFRRLFLARRDLLTREVVVCLARRGGRNCGKESAQNVISTCYLDFAIPADQTGMDG